MRRHRERETESQLNKTHGQTTHNGNEKRLSTRQSDRQEHEQLSHTLTVFLNGQKAETNSVLTRKTIAARNVRSAI